MDGPYHRPYTPVMKFKPEWTQGKKATYHAARKRYNRTGTKEALADNVSGMKKMLRRWKTTDVSKEKIAELETAVEHWEAKRDEA